MSENTLVLSGTRNEVNVLIDHTAISRPYFVLLPFVLLSTFLGLLRVDLIGDLATNAVFWIVCGFLDFAHLHLGFLRVYGNREVYHGIRKFILLPIPFHQVSI